MIHLSSIRVTQIIEAASYFKLPRNTGVFLFVWMSIYTMDTIGIYLA